MARLEVNFYSRVLDHGETVSVILPEKQHGIGMLDPGVSVTKATASWDGVTPLKSLYLLHGWSDDNTVWGRRTSIERYVAGTQMAVIMPNAADSYYTDEANGYPYFQYISEELPEVMGSFFKLSARREDTFAAGLSMGGYGALKLGLRCPDRFSKVASLSGATNLEGEFAAYRRGEDLGWYAAPMLRRVFGSDADPVLRPEDSVVELSKKLAASGAEKPKVYLSCGTEDSCYPAFLREKQLLEEHGFDLTARSIAGIGHCWKLWDSEIQSVLDWLDIR